MQTCTFQIPLTLPVFIVNLALWFVLRYRKLRYGYPFRKIPLTRGFYAIVDPEDYQMVIKYKWHVRLEGSNRYAGSVKRGVGKKRYYFLMHRLIMDSEINSKLKIKNQYCPINLRLI